jgi:tubulin-specific chaperone A
MADPRIKALRIKTGIVKRLTKEKIMYEKDADEQRQRIQKFKDEGKKTYLTGFF